VPIHGLLDDASRDVIGHHWRDRVRIWIKKLNSAACSPFTKAADSPPEFETIAPRTVSKRVQKEKAD